MDYKDKKETFKARTVILEMIKDRGYNIPDDLNIDFTIFKVMYENDNIFININDNGKLIHIYFDKGLKTFGKNHLKNLVTEIREKYKDNSIKILIILKDKYNSNLKKKCKIHIIIMLKFYCKIIYNLI